MIYIIFKKNSIKSNYQLFSILQNKYQMEIQTPNNFLPLDVAIKYYKKWDCDINCKVEDSIYQKYLSGSGNVEFLNGNSYNGVFKNGLMHGNGIYKWKNGLLYQGQFINNSVTGQGKLIWQDGSHYLGAVLNGKRNGYGQYFCATDQSNYKGDWKNGLKQGKGVLNFLNGSIYEGEFQNGLRQGKGKMKYPSANEYQGEWKNDKKCGHGVMNWITSYQKYQGEWENDVPSGNGSYYWYEGKNDNKNIKSIYKGQWKAGKRDGLGAFYYNNGCKLEGIFSNNLKQGVCFLMDQFGDGHIQSFKHDKSISKKQEIALKQEKRHFKLPEISNLSKKQNILQNNQPTQNNYSKYIDFQSSFIDQSIYNLLLRQNSQLRQWYKTIVSNLNKQIFNGLNIEGLWRLIRDMKLTDQSITIAKLNRQFYQGYKSRYELGFANKAKLQLIKKQSKLFNSHDYYDIQWKVFFQEAKNMNLQWDKWPDNLKSIDIDKISLNAKLNIHNQSQIILFRHFIVYLLHLALLQYEHYSQVHKNITFRKCLEELMVSIKSVVNPAPSSMKTEKICSQMITNVSHNQAKTNISEEYSSLNRLLFEQLNRDKPQLLNTIDRTVTVKQIYCLMKQVGLLKQPAEKMLFLQKIQRNMNVKSSLLKKQNKNYYPSFEKIVLKSPHFCHIVNYEMIEAEFDEIIYILLNRKIGNTQDKEQYIKRYKEMINTMVKQVVKVKKELQQERKEVKFNFRRISTKDNMKAKLMQQIEEERKRKIQQQIKKREMNREERQRKLMKKEDINVKDDEYSEDSQQYYD